MIGITLGEGQTLTAHDVDTIKETIKVMIKAAREEVLDGVKITIDTMIDYEKSRKSRLGRMENKKNLLEFTKKMIIQDNQLRFRS